MKRVDAPARRFRVVGPPQAERETAGYRLTADPRCSFKLAGVGVQPALQGCWNRVETGGSSAHGRSAREQGAETWIWGQGLATIEDLNARTSSSKLSTLSGGRERLGIRRWRGYKAPLAEQRVAVGLRASPLGWLPLIGRRAGTTKDYCACGHSLLARHFSKAERDLQAWDLVAFASLRRHGPFSATFMPSL